MRKLFLFLLLVFAGWVGWRVYVQIFTQTTGEETRQRSVVVPVEVSPIEKTTLRDIGSFTGTLNAKSKYEVAPKTNGRLEKLAVNIGDSVKRGDLIAALDDDEIIQQLDQVRAELTVAKANVDETQSTLENTRREYERVKTLRERKIASQAELDTAEANLAVAEAKEEVALAQVSQKEAAVRATEVRLSYSRIIADWDEGSDVRVVGERYVDEGTMLSANSPIVSILDIQKMVAVIQIIERDYSKVKIGQTAIVMTDAYPGRSFTGHIVRIAPLMKESSRQARVEIELENPEQLLKPGMFVRVEIEFEEHRNVTAVPTAALAKRQGKQGVFLADLENMKVSFIPVEFGIINTEYAEVLQPSLNGWVVTLGQHLLENGSTITVPDRQSIPTQIPATPNLLSASEEPSPNRVQ